MIDFAVVGAFVFDKDHESGLDSIQKKHDQYNQQKYDQMYQQQLAYAQQNQSYGYNPAPNLGPLDFHHFEEMSCDETGYVTHSIRSELIYAGQKFIKQTYLATIPTVAGPHQIKWIEGNHEAALRADLEKVWNPYSDWRSAMNRPTSEIYK
jgi:hypothetical protein